MAGKTRAEHLEWCKRRALQALESGSPAAVCDSMFSDMGKHPETKGHPAIELGSLLLLGGHLNTREQVAEFIDGFN